MESALSPIGDSMRRHVSVLVVLALALTLVPMPVSAGAASTYVYVRPPAKVVSYARAVAKKGWKVWYPTKLPRGASVSSIRVFNVKKTATSAAGTVCLVSVRKGTQWIWIWNGPRQIVSDMSNTTIPWGPYRARIYQELAAIRTTSLTSHSARVNTNVTQLKVICASMRVVK